MKRMTLAAIAFVGAAIFAGGSTASAQTPTTTMTPMPTTTVDTAKAQDTTSVQATTTQTTTTVETTTIAEPTTQARQSSCRTAPAVASGYLREQGGRLKMPRAAVIAEITKETGADGEFAGLKPCDSGYPNAVRFVIDEVIKAGTDHSTPQG
jgi:hypothetical protein